MVLYHVGTAYQLLNAVEHKLIFHRNDYAVLIIADFLTLKYPQYTLLKNNIFDEIRIIEYRNIRENDLSEQIAMEVCEKCIPDYNDYDNIYLAGIQMWISLFFIEKGITFFAFEEASGAFSRPEILKHNDVKISEIRYRLIDEKGLYEYNNPCIGKVICNWSAQLEEYKDNELLVDFDPVKSLEQIDEAELQFIMSFFGCPEKIAIEEPQNSVVILTQQLANLNVVSFEEQMFMYQVWVDYFFHSDKLIFKRHPDDLAYYSLLFPGAMVINEKFPSEFLPYIFTDRPQTIATMYSTGIFNISHMFSAVHELDMNFEKSCFKLNKYYYAICVANNLGFNISSNVYADSKLMNEMTNKYLCCDNEKSDYLEVIDDDFVMFPMDADEIVQKFDLYKTQAIYFMNDDLLLPDAVNRLLEFGNVKVLSLNQKKNGKENVFFEEKQSKVMLWVNKLCNGEIGQFMEKELKYSGMTISANVVNDIDCEKEILRAQIRALEKRLEIEINENNKMRNNCYENPN